MSTTQSDSNNYITYETYFSLKEEVKQLRAQNICLEDGEECAAVSLRDQLEQLRELCASRPQAPNLNVNLDDPTQVVSLYKTFQEKLTAWQSAIDAEGAKHVR